MVALEDTMSGGNGRYNPLLGLGYPPRQPTLSELLDNGLLPPERPQTLGVLSNGLLGSPPPTNPFAAALQPAQALKPGVVDGIRALLEERYRTRSSWNERLNNWSRPASDTEEATIERARSMVDQRLRRNQWLRDEGITIGSQGSYHNNTNVRREADIDLRAVHPTVHVDYSPEVISGYADQNYGYRHDGPRSVPLWDNMRKQIVAQLSREFGASHVDATGKKAIRLKGIPGSRADVDVVPSSILHYIEWNSLFGVFERHIGIAILSTDGKWTLNFPDQHHANGKTKRANTRHRFKKIVRIFKHLRTDMKERGLLKLEIPSFLIECLVYAIDDKHFLVETDDHYDRVKRIALEIARLLRDPNVSLWMREINGVKMLFGPGQAWTPMIALAFMNIVILHLGDA
jgi:hypothetical protein